MQIPGVIYRWCACTLNSEKPWVTLSSHGPLASVPKMWTAPQSLDKHGVGKRMALPLMSCVISVSFRSLADPQASHLKIGRNNSNNFKGKRKELNKIMCSPYSQWDALHIVRGQAMVKTCKSTHHRWGHFWFCNGLVIDLLRNLSSISLSTQWGQ